jgi:hypothetical protein
LFPGRIPSSFLKKEDVSPLTADEVRSMITSYATVLFKEHLPSVDWIILEHFSQACILMTNSWISRQDLLRADAHLLSFCQKAQAAYGEDFVTPNMHLHLHLKETIEDHGPTAAFWLFSFERFFSSLTLTSPFIQGGP